jgi:hypothetical protein
MNSITYKVIFREKENIDASERSLTFANVISKNYFYLPPNFISSMKVLSEQKNNIIYFQNISEVIIQGWERDPPLFSYFLLILLLTKKKEKKEGFLIGNIKKLKGDILIGVWPINRTLDDFNLKSVKRTFNDILTNYDDFRKIVLIHS